MKGAAAFAAGIPVHFEGRTWLIRPVPDWIETARAAVDGQVTVYTFLEAVLGPVHAADFLSGGRSHKDTFRFLALVGDAVGFIPQLGPPRVAR